MASSAKLRKAREAYANFENGGSCHATVHKESSSDLGTHSRNAYKDWAVEDELRMDRTHPVEDEWKSEVKNQVCL